MDPQSRMGVLRSTDDPRRGRDQHCGGGGKQEHGWLRVFSLQQSVGAPSVGASQRQPPESDTLRVAPGGWDTCREQGRAEAPREPARGRTVLRAPVGCGRWSSIQEKGRLCQAGHNPSSRSPRGQRRGSWRRTLTAACGPRLGLDAGSRDVKEWRILCCFGCFRCRGHKL